MPLFSVVMPVFNVEKYIKDSVLSICAQSFRDFELILVDDGSTDESIAIAEAVLKEQNVDHQVLHKENGGQASARNIGISEAAGEWILCVDSDDCLHPKTLEMVALQTDDASNNVIAFDFVRVNAQNPLYSPIDDNVEIIRYGQRELANKFLLRELKLIVPSLVIRSTVYKSTQFRYNEQCRFSEDQLFIWEMIFQIERLCFIQAGLYYYLKRPNSIMTTSSRERIMTGYRAFRTFTQNISEISNIGIDPNHIFARWVIGSLHAASKIMPYKEFCILSDDFKYKECIPKLSGFQDKRILAMASILKFSRSMFYRVCRVL